LSVVSVLCGQVEVSATCQSLVQKSPTEFGVPLCVMWKLQESGGHDLRWAAAPQQTKSSTNASLFGQQIYKVWLGGSAELYNKSCGLQTQFTE